MNLVGRKEKQFQVVPVPSLFIRGRWECIEQYCFNVCTSSVSDAVTTGGPSVVAIDNKIEQAMDLVKTHLTFAVREEVEILRSTIMDLENKVNFLENENQILRQFAPIDFISTLPSFQTSSASSRRESTTPSFL
uniref:Uncharacterized protein n=2 Tax=Meloidogyne TaxID=189290 RepID=A0A915NNX8_9BILA